MADNNGSRLSMQLNKWIACKLVFAFMSILFIFCHVKTEWEERSQKLRELDRSEH